MGDYFFITGLPRSRTGWLANLFTHGASFCYHDGLQGCASVKELKAKMANTPGYYIGNSDSGLSMVWPELLKEFPKARIANVWRSVDAAVKSFMDFFSEHPYQGQPALKVKDVEAVFKRAQDDLTQLVCTWPARQVYEIKYDDLDKDVAVERLWQFLIPRSPFVDCEFDARRFQLLNKLRINPASEKIRVNPEEVLRLIA